MPYLTTHNIPTLSILVSTRMDNKNNNCISINTLWSVSVIVSISFTNVWFMTNIMP